MADNSFAFDPEWYRRAYPDVAAAGMDPVTHYRNYGQAEGRGINAQHPTGDALATSPASTGSQRFDAGNYLSANPDVKAAGQDALQHYLTNGYAEGRGINSQDRGNASVGGTPMLNPSDPNSWAAFQMMGHAQTQGINNMPRTLSNTQQLNGMSSGAVMDRFYPSSPEAKAWQAQRDAQNAPPPQAAAAVAADAPSEQSAAALEQLLMGMQSDPKAPVMNLGMGAAVGNAMGGGYQPGSYKNRGGIQGYRSVG